MLAGFRRLPGHLRCVSPRPVPRFSHVAIGRPRTTCDCWVVALGDGGFSATICCNRTGQFCPPGPRQRQLTCSTLCLLNTMSLLVDHIDQPPGMLACSLPDHVWEFLQWTSACAWGQDCRHLVSDLPPKRGPISPAAPPLQWQIQSQQVASAQGAIYADSHSITRP